MIVDQKLSMDKSYISFISVRFIANKAVIFQLFIKVAKCYFLQNLSCRQQEKKCCNLILEQKADKNRYWLKIYAK